MGLFLQQQLLIAGYALSKFCGHLVGFIKRGDDNRVHIGYGCRHGFSLRAKQIHIAVEQGLIILRSNGANMHLASAVTLGLILFYNLCPEQTGSTELGYFHEIVLRDTHVELDTLGSLGGIDASLGQQVQILSTPGKGIAQFLIDIGTSIVERHAVHIDALIARQLCQGLNERLSAFKNGRNILSLAQDLADGIEIDATLQISQRIVLLLEIVHQNLSQFHTMALASLEVQLHILGQDAFQQCSHEFLADVLSRNLESQRVDAFVQNVEGLGIGNLGIIHLNVLTHEPEIVVFLVSTHEGELSWQ